MVNDPTGNAFSPTINIDSGIPDAGKYCTIFNGIVCDTILLQHDVSFVNAVVITSDSGIT